jgi:hypothetical protein
VVGEDIGFDVIATSRDLKLHLALTNIAVTRSQKAQFTGQTFIFRGEIMALKFAISIERKTKN